VFEQLSHEGCKASLIGVARESGEGANNDLRSCSKEGI
jgi:hypothetical protein